MISGEKPSEQQALPYRWVVFFTVVFCYFMIFSQRTAPGIITDTLMKEFHIPASTLGLLAGIQYFAYMCLQIPLGIWADKFGPSRFLLLGTLLDGIGTIAYSLAPNASFLMVSRLVVGIGDAMIWINIVLILSEWFLPKEFAALLGWTGMSGSLGTIVTTVPLTYWIAAEGWRVPFLSLGSILVVCAVMIYVVLIRNKHAKQSMQTRSQRASNVTGQESNQTVRTKLKRIVRSKQAWATFFCHFGLVGTYIGFIGAWAIPYMMNVYHVSRTSAGELVSLGVLGAMVGGPLTGFVSNRLHSRKRPYVVIHLITFLSWLLFILLGGKPPFAVMVLLFLLIGYGNGGSMLTFAMVRESFPASEIGLASGFANTGGFLSAVLLPGLFGYVLDLFQPSATAHNSVTTGYHYGFFVPALFSLLGLFGSLLLHEKREVAKKVKVGVPKSVQI